MESAVLARQPILQASSAAAKKRIGWHRLVSLLGMHAGCLALFWVGWSWSAVAVAVSLYVARAFGLTAFYHRYFSHRAFKTSRWFQFAGALLGCAAAQKGPLWWAAHHREHHRRADNEGDVHSPRQHGVLWAHMLWFLTDDNNTCHSARVRDWTRFPELVWLDRLSMLVPVIGWGLLYATGTWLNRTWPSLGTSGGQFLVWGGFVSTVCLYHVTYSINSLAHLWGRRRFATRDDSRNNLPLAILTLGEGWHNNHHFHASSARQGFYWWEIDLTYYGLVGLSWLGLVWDLKPVPARVLELGRGNLAKRSGS
ncbi:MAG: acyl-CoA desaturase [Pirellulales bacterium]